MWRRNQPGMTSIIIKRSLVCGCHASLSNIHSKKRTKWRKNHFIWNKSMGIYLKTQSVLLISGDKSVKWMLECRSFVSWYMDIQHMDKRREIHFLRDSYSLTNSGRLRFSSTSTDRKEEEEHIHDKGQHCGMSPLINNT